MCSGFHRKKTIGPSSYHPIEDFRLDMMEAGELRFPEIEDDERLNPEEQEEEEIPVELTDAEIAVFEELASDKDLGDIFGLAMAFLWISMQPN